MVKVMFRDKEWEVRAGMTVRDAILKVGLDPQAVLPVRDDKLINEATLLRDGETVPNCLLTNVKRSDIIVAIRARECVLMRPSSERPPFALRVPGSA